MIHAYSICVEHLQTCIQVGFAGVADCIDGLVCFRSTFAVHSAETCDDQQSSGPSSLIFDIYVLLMFFPVIKRLRDRRSRFAIKHPDFSSLSSIVL